MNEQTKIDSFMEALVNVAIGFAINFSANAIILPLMLGVPMDLGLFGLIGVIYTVISVARSYFIRRAFNGLSVWDAIKGRYYGTPPAREQDEGRLLKGQ